MGELTTGKLTRRHEADQPIPWKMGDAPTDYIAEQLRNVVGIEVRITRLEATSPNSSAPMARGGDDRQHLGNYA